MEEYQNVIPEGDPKMSDTKKQEDQEKGLLIHVITRSSKSPEVQHSVITIPAPEKLVPDNESKLARYIKDTRREDKIETLKASILRILTRRLGADAAQGIAPQLDMLQDAEKLALIFEEASVTPSTEELRKLWA